MKSTHWTFLYVPTDQGDVRTMRVDKRWFAALVILSGLLVAATLLLTVSYARQGIVLRKAEERERENLALLSRVGEIEGKVYSFEQEMDTNFELQDRAFTLAGLPAVDDAMKEVGVGGSAPAADPELDALSPLDRARVLDLREDLDKLLRQARFQREGYQHLVQVLQQEKFLRDTTPSIQPVQKGYLSSRYGRRIDPFTGREQMHRGVDYSAPIGTLVYATADGRVIRAGKRGSLGQMVEIDHGNGIVTRYGHLQQFTVGVGEDVERGQVIGHVGNTGRSTAPHLHYEIVEHDRSQNPLAYILDG